MRKIKLPCRKKNGSYETQLYVDAQLHDSAFDEETCLAQQFFDAISPQSLTDAGTARCEDFVLVLRTDDEQMQTFGALLQEHGGAISHNAHMNLQIIP